MRIVRGHTHFDVYGIWQGATPLLVSEEPASNSTGGEGTRIAQAIRWAQGLSGGELRGAVHGSVEPLRHRAAGLPTTWNTIGPYVGLGEPRDDELWRYVEITAGVPAAEVVSTVRESSRRFDCLGWVGVDFLEAVPGGGMSATNDARRICTECHLEKDESRFMDDSPVCLDCT